MGTRVGDNVIIGAGAVCHGILESDSVYAGNPARRICSLEDYNKRCANQYIESAQEYVREFKKSHGRIPKIEEMYSGFMPLFGKSYSGYIEGKKYPIFNSIEELLGYEK